MPNITITIDDEIHRLAQARAAELNTTLSAVLCEYLAEFAERSANSPPADDKEAKLVELEYLVANSSPDTRGELLRALLRLPLEERRRVMRHATIEVDKGETDLWDTLPWPDEDTYVRGEPS